MTSRQYLDLAVLGTYLLLIVGVGAYFALRRKSSSQFMTADQTMPGWAVGLSMFGSYISSISFLANPASSYAGNWLYAVFTLVTPLGMVVGVYVFMPFYRRSGAVSAYEHLEHRFGPWARSYAVFTYLVIQMARMGTILFLLSQAVLPLFGLHPVEDIWWARAIILAIGLLIIAYTLFGGIEAVVWIGVLQSMVLLIGPLVCIVTLLVRMPGGLPYVFEVAGENDKFSLGPYMLSLAAPTFWLLLLSSILGHIVNWGMDQSYIQRYSAARSEKDAARSIWIAGFLYMPVAGFFWFIGTTLYAYYTAMPDRLPPGLPPDSVFPHFIAFELLPGLSGLVIAAIFAASMDSNLNSMATLTLIDGYKRYFRPRAPDRESLFVLYGATIFWGFMSIAFGMFMTLKGATTTIEFSARIGSLLGGGVFGLLVLGMISKRVNNRGALVATLAGVLVIVWMSLSRWGVWPESWARFVSPVHEIGAAMVGTAVILVLGLVFAALTPPPEPERIEAGH